jgi:hypothetical protein
VASWTAFIKSGGVLGFVNCSGSLLNASEAFSASALTTSREIGSGWDPRQMIRMSICWPWNGPGGLRSRIHDHHQYPAASIGKPIKLTQVKQAISAMRLMRVPSIMG